ncbi:12144_t:CDS:2, partial [Dentiscutata heterogama]
SAIIVISDSDDNNDSDDDELPSLETVLKNITKFTRYKKINNIELIEIQDDTMAANNNNDDFTRQLQDPLAIDRLVPGYYGMKGYMLMYEHLMKNTAVWELNLGTDMNKQEFMREVIIPELGVMFIMTDFEIYDYDTAIIITRKSVEYGNKNFFEDRNDDCFW